MFVRDVALPADGAGEASRARVVQPVMTVNANASTAIERPQACASLASSRLERKPRANLSA